MIPIPLLAAGMQLLNTALSGDKKEDEKFVTEVLNGVKKMAIDKPFYLSKRFIGTAITTILLMFNNKLGLNLGLEEIIAITTLVGVYVGGKSYEQKN